MQSGGFWVDSAVLSVGKKKSSVPFAIAASSEDAWWGVGARLDFSSHSTSLLALLCSKQPTWPYAVAWTGGWLK